MPRALLLLPLLLTAAAAADVFVVADTANDTLTIADNTKRAIAQVNDISLSDDALLQLNDTLDSNLNDTVADDIDHDPVVRKKRTFGDIVFRGLADVLGYNVARKPAQTAFPPPLAPVPGIDAPIQAGPAPAPAPAPPPPCGAPRAAAPPPCRAQAPPPPPPPPKPTPAPCPRPRAAPKPKPRPKPRPPPPPPQPPCARPRANPTTPSPCAPKPPPPPPPPAPPKSDNLETITSNLRLNFNFNRSPANQAPAAQDEEEQVEQEEEQYAPVAIEPRAARLPLEQPRQPRVYVDAFVVRNGVTQKVHAVDAQNLNQQRNADDDYLAYDDDQPQEEQQDDDYEDVQESRDRAKAVREFGTAVDRFWEQKQKPKRKLPANDYRNVHFGDRDLVNQFRRQSDESHQPIQQGRSIDNHLPPPEAAAPEAEEESEVTTTTQNPRRRLKPRVLPPTEQNPNQIDTITVRVPPIYKEKRPKKLHRERPEQPDRNEEDNEHVAESDESNYDSDSDNSAHVFQTEAPKRKRRKKKNRRTRATESEAYTAGDYDYFGKEIPISEEEKSFRALTIPPPTKDADLARLEEETDNRHFLDDHERLVEDPERIRDDKKDDKSKSDSSGEADSYRSDDDDDKYKADENERSREDKERAGENERSDERERTDKLSPNARVRESGYQNNYVRASNVQVDDPDPFVASVKKKTTKIG